MQRATCPARCAGPSYWDINAKRVWAVVHDDLPPLIAAIEDYLAVN
jgi:hypothetical protein